MIERFKTLAYSLPALRLLRKLDLFGLKTTTCWPSGARSEPAPLPPPLLDHKIEIAYATINLKLCWQALALPPEAADWDDTAILQHWRV